MDVMKTVIPLSEYTQAHFLGSRYSARPLRQELENMLAEHHEITVDFKGMSATQSFIDEFVGMLILKNGEALLSRIVFKGCSADIKAILQFVISRRTEDFRKANQH